MPDQFMPLGLLEQLLFLSERASYLYPTKLHCEQQIMVPTFKVVKLNASTTTRLMSQLLEDKVDELGPD